MVAEVNCNTIALTDLLVRDHPEIASTILETCKSKGIVTRIIEGANDYWCRDFMPVQVNRNKFVQFTYDPAYYKSPKYKHLKTDLTKLNYRQDNEVLTCPVVLDGGNICYHKTKAIVTDRVFKDNPGITRLDLINCLKKLLEVDSVTIIPSLPYDITGHSDGMIRFIDDNILLLNDFRLITGDSYWKKLLKALCKFKLILLPNDLHLNKSSDDATGDYINMINIKDLIFIPSYGKITDQLAHKIIKMSLPYYTIIPIPSNDLSIRGGVLHCASWNVLE
jgi:agmatine deiminase